MSIFIFCSDLFTLQLIVIDLILIAHHRVTQYKIYLRWLPTVHSTRSENTIVKWKHDNSKSGNTRVARVESLWIGKKNLKQAVCFQTLCQGRKGKFLSLIVNF